MQVTGVSIHVNIADPVGELERMISYVVSQQHPEQHLFILERLQLSLAEGIERVKGDREIPVEAAN